MSYGQMLIQDIVQVYDAKMNELRVKLLPDVKAALDQIKNDDERKIVADFIKERMNLTLTLSNKKSPTSISGGSSRL